VLSLIITVLSLSVMLLIIASFVIGERRVRRHHEQQRYVPHAQFHVCAPQILQQQNGMVISIEQPVHQTTFSLSPSWYTRRRTLVSLGLLLMMMLTLFVQSGLADGVFESLGKIC
jgi:hypothetical protein